jgi:epoxyqueuosine reductase
VRLGLTTPEPFERGGRALERWLARAQHGEMAYMSERRERSEPSRLWPEAKSLIVVALPYPRVLAKVDEALHGVIARYARGTDYHLVMRQKLAALSDELAGIAGRPVTTRACVDTAPLLEREAAARAGVGFISVSTMSIVPGIGSYVLLGELLTDLELPSDSPLSSRCGTCDICRAACPTGAIVERYVVDARRCIAYLTIEHKGPIPRELRLLMGRRVFGCDVCQEVCPFNASKRARPEAKELAPRPALEAPALTDLLELGAAAYRRLVKGTALERTSRNQLARNAAVALGNCGDSRAMAALARALASHTSPLVRAHAAWALGRLGGVEARRALADTARLERDLTVKAEADEALRALDESAPEAPAVDASGREGRGNDADARA